MGRGGGQIDGEGRGGPDGWGGWSKTRWIGRTGENHTVGEDRGEPYG